MLFSVSHSLKKAFALAATTSSWGNLSEFVSTTRSISTTAVHSTGSSVGDTSVIENKKATAKNLLFDVPVSNNGGRCRIILYKKKIPESECSVVTPMELGGFKSEEYLAINPQGKVPSLKCQITGRCFAESDTVCRYLLSTYSDLGPSFQPENPLSNEIARFHDMYLTTIQSCLYRAAPPFGPFWTRKDALNEYSKQLYVISDLMSEQGPYLIVSRWRSAAVTNTKKDRGLVSAHDRHGCCI
ncbi:unnamed protein product [Pseudo-nitzschia multistriata]|uniref:GST N-terminal domain-containing protein n=1 Tax=Pseudo-nitzschia multistriata TaxID=183589 RepID=A0A448ZST5_9STRA|nr:unnamed protein product [Pseudo-nitzschia multistriata]